MDCIDGPPSTPVWLIGGSSTETGGRRNLRSRDLLTSLLPCWAMGHLHPSLEAHLLSHVPLPSLLNPDLVTVPSRIPSARQCQCSLLFLALRYITFPRQFPLTLPASLQRVPSVDMTVTFTCQHDWATGAQTFGQSFLWVCL